MLLCYLLSCCIIANRLHNNAHLVIVLLLTTIFVLPNFLEASVLRKERFVYDSLDVLALPYGSSLVSKQNSWNHEPSPILGVKEAMYIRVKRNKTTYFIQCDPTETTLSIKQKLHSLIDQPPSNQQLILLATTEVVLDDSKTLADQKVENDAVVALTLRKDDNEFEEVSIARPEDFMSSS